MSGKEDNAIQLQNKLHIFVTLFVFHLDISGKLDKYSHEKNK